MIRRNAKLTQRAQELRKNATPEERHLWYDFLKDHPQREAILSGQKRFDAVSARAIYPSLDFLPSRATGYAPCICGKRCDIACYRHLMEGKSHDKA